MVEANIRYLYNLISVRDAALHAVHNVNAGALKPKKETGQHAADRLFEEFSVKTQKTQTSRYVKSRNGYRIMASDGVFAGFARPENTLILRVQSRRSLGDLTKARSDRQRSTSNDLLGPQTPDHLQNAAPMELPRHGPS
jgi:hypothetical protein